MPQPGGPLPWCPSGSRLELSWEIILFGLLPEAEMTTKTEGNSGPLATTALGTNCHLLPFWEGWLGGGARSCPIIMMLVSREQSGDRAEPAGAWTRTGPLTADVTISPPFFPFLRPLPASWSEWSGSGSASVKPQNSDPPAPIPGVWLFPWPVALLPGQPLLAFPRPQGHLAVCSLSGITKGPCVAVSTGHLCPR